MRPVSAPDCEFGTDGGAGSSIEQRLERRPCCCGAAALPVISAGWLQAELVPFNLRQFERCWAGQACNPQHNQPPRARPGTGGAGVNKRTSDNMALQPEEAEHTFKVRPARSAVPGSLCAVGATTAAEAEAAHLPHTPQILLVGDSGVGKSSLLLRFTTGGFEELAPTIGARGAAQELGCTSACVGQPLERAPCRLLATAAPTSSRWLPGSLAHTAPSRPGPSTTPAPCHDHSAPPLPHRCGL